VIDALVYLIILMIVGGVLYYILQRAIAVFGIPPPVAGVVEILALLLFVLAVLGVVFGGVDLGKPIWRD
jgi:hypothetical protein